MHNPSSSDFTALKRILSYIKGTLSFGLHINKGPLKLIAFSDTDWAGDPSDRRSTTGYCVIFGLTPVSWCAKKQQTIAQSSTKAEYRSLAHTAAEISWLPMLLQDLHVYLPHCPLIWCDNISAISLDSNPIFHARTKYVDIDYHFVREKVLSKDLDIHYISTND